MKQLTMFVVTHKQVNLPIMEGYKPIVVGNKDVSYTDMYKDNTQFDWVILIELMLWLSLKRNVNFFRSITEKQQQINEG